MVIASVTRAGRYVAVQHKGHCRGLLERHRRYVALQQSLGTEN